MHDSSDSAGQQQSQDDSQLLAWLGDVLAEAEQPPAQMMELARQSFTLRQLDAELAALVEDSAMDSSAELAVRGQAPLKQRQLSFQFSDDGDDDELVVAVEVELLGGRRRLTGQLSSRRPAEIEIRQSAAPEVRRIDVDHLGRFIIDDVLPGPMSLTCRRANARPVATQWTTV